MYATNTRQDIDDDASLEEEEDFIIASKINATINASVKTYHFVLNKYPDYTGDVILEHGCDWKMITRCVVRDMNIYSDLETVLKTRNSQNSEIDMTTDTDIKGKIKELLQQMTIKYLIDVSSLLLIFSIDILCYLMQMVKHYHQILIIQDYFGNLLIIILLLKRHIL